MDKTFRCAVLFSFLSLAIYPLFSYGDENNTLSTESSKPIAPIANDSSPNPLTGSIDIVSNYVVRGVSQTENGPAIQGGLTYTWKNGIYVSFWGSNVKFENSNAYVEFDPTIGYQGTIGDKVGYNAYFVRYVYPKASGLEYNDLMLNLSYNIFKVTLGYSNDFFAHRYRGEYYALGVDYPVPTQYSFNVPGIAIGASAGRSIFIDLTNSNYNNYRIYISKELNKNLKFILNFTDTNGGYHNPPYDKAHIFADLSANF